MQGMAASRALGGKFRGVACPQPRSRTACAVHVSYMWGAVSDPQEKLVADMEKALLKREIIAVKGRAVGAKAGASGRGSPAASAAASSTSSLTRNQLDRAAAELARSIKVGRLGAAGPGRTRQAAGRPLHVLQRRDRAYVYVYYMNT